ncbi:hypothetical protein BDV95DRAFT_70080 [Massariosphaeria phaeospora]|uniref:Uncharacterized protein n=1 Tax=Massariosphaeria phaeospora TaxID=100035 RepID=A0A7C8M785_9PLEO|nr:hypothetical protein BDV95DRAFT_70080 [Massariosphaeria phaeospora]
MNLRQKNQRRAPQRYQGDGTYVGDPDSSPDFAHEQIFAQSTVNKRRHTSDQSRGERLPDTPESSPHPESSPESQPANFDTSPLLPTPPSRRDPRSQPRTQSHEMANIRHVKSNKRRRSAPQSQEPPRSTRARVAVESFVDSASPTPTERPRTQVRASKRISPPATPALKPAVFPTLSAVKPTGDTSDASDEDVDLWKLPNLLEERCSGDLASQQISYERIDRLYNKKTVFPADMSEREKRWYNDVKSLLAARSPEGEPKIQFEQLWRSLRQVIIDQLIDECPNAPGGLYGPVMRLLHIPDRAVLDKILAENSDVHDIPQYIWDLKEEFPDKPIDPDMPPPEEVVKAIKYLRQEHLPASLLGEWQFRLPRVEIAKPRPLSKPSHASPLSTSGDGLNKSSSLTLLRQLDKTRSQTTTTTLPSTPLSMEVSMSEEQEEETASSIDKSTTTSRSTPSGVASYRTVQEEHRLQNQGMQNSNTIISNLSNSEHQEGIVDDRTPKNAQQLNDLSRQIFPHRSDEISGLPGRKPTFPLDKDWHMGGPTLSSETTRSPHRAALGESSPIQNKADYQQTLIASYKESMQKSQADRTSAQPSVSHRRGPESPLDAADDAAQIPSPERPKKQVPPVQQPNQVRRGSQSGQAVPLGHHRGIQSSLRKPGDLSVEQRGARITYPSGSAQEQLMRQKHEHTARSKSTKQPSFDQDPSLHTGGSHNHHYTQPYYHTGTRNESTPQPHPPQGSSSGLNAGHIQDHTNVYSVPPTGPYAYTNPFNPISRPLPSSQSPQATSPQMAGSYDGPNQYLPYGLPKSDSSPGSNPLLSRPQQHSPPDTSMNTYKSTPSDMLQRSDSTQLPTSVKAPLASGNVTRHHQENPIPVDPQLLGLSDLSATSGKVSVNSVQDVEKLMGTARKRSLRNSSKGDGHTD